MTLQEVLEENKTRVRKNKYLELQRKQLKKENKKETILTMFIGAFILVATIMLLCNLNNKFIDDCTKSGHSKTYCERGL